MHFLLSRLAKMKNGLKFEKAELHNPDNQLLLFAKINPGITIWQAPLVPKFVEDTIDIGLIDCPKELQQKFDELTEKPSVTTPKNDGVEHVIRTAKLDVKTVGIDSEEHCYFYFYAVDCTDSRALDKIEKFCNSHLLNVQRQQVFLFPINHDKEFTLKRVISKKQIEDFADKHNNVCSYQPIIMEMNWDEIFAVLTDPKKQAPQKEAAATETNLRSVVEKTDGKDEKVVVARDRIKSLIDELEKEVTRCAFIRFFTDFNNTKIVKLSALKYLYESTADINDFDTFSETVSNYVNSHAQKDLILFTTRPLTSLTATLISDLTKDNGKELLKDKPALQI